MKHYKFIITFLFALMIFYGCKDPYMPELKNIKSNILVVEGYIDGVNGTNVILSKVKPLGEPDTSFQKYVSNASIAIEDDKGNKFPLSNNGNGNYNGKYNLSPYNKYRLEIITADQKKYLSDFVKYKVSPPINAITYKIEEEGARFYVNTKDNTNQSKYYRWKFTETWSFHSFYRSSLKYDPVKIEVVDNTDPIYYCWQSDVSKGILIHSTTNLNEDVVRDMPINFIPNGSFKLSDMYSINVRQYVMDSIGYDYYQQLKKNTEETGSIFDPQPGSLKGNIKNVNDKSEIVVGYINAGSSYEMRQFFVIPWKYVPDCSTITYVQNSKDSLQYYFGDDSNWPLYFDYEMRRWKAAEKVCVDCRVRGTNIKPYFWP